MNEIRISEAAYRRARGNIARLFVQTAVKCQGTDFARGQLSALHAAFMAIPGSTEEQFIAMCSEHEFCQEMRSVVFGAVA